MWGLFENVVHIFNSKGQDTIAIPHIPKLEVCSEKAKVDSLMQCWLRMLRSVTLVLLEYPCTMRYDNQQDTQPCAGVHAAGMSRAS